jgi:hypothetical protein
MPPTGDKKWIGMLMVVVLGLMALTGCAATPARSGYLGNSVTGERLAAMVDRKAGTPIQLAGAFKRLGHAKAAFEAWAKELKTALDTNP